MALHLEQHLQRDIDRIREKILDMSGRAEQALSRSLKAFHDRSRQTAYSVILRDQYIDQLEKEIDRLCLEFLVRQQPAAGNLRFVYAAIKINSELERIGDYAENIARQVLKLNSIETEVPYEKYEGIARASIAMLHDAVQSFVREDIQLARRTAAIEDRIDCLRNEINAELRQLERDGRVPFEAFTPLATIARRYERVSDQAKNICEEVMYLCTGEYAKHPGSDIFRILFVDEHNSCRSQMAEAMGNALGNKRLVFSSAGLDPQPVSDTTAAFMKLKGVDISHQKSKSIRQVPNIEAYQVVVALAKSALSTFLIVPGKTVQLDWSMEDPSRREGTPGEKQAAYEQAHQQLRAQIHDLVEAIEGENEKH